MFAGVYVKLKTVLKQKEMAIVPHFHCKYTQDTLMDNRQVPDVDTNRRKQVRLKC